MIARHLTYETLLDATLLLVVRWHVRCPVGFLDRFFACRFEEIQHARTVEIVDCIAIACVWTVIGIVGRRSELYRTVREGDGGL